MFDNALKFFMKNIHLVVLALYAYFLMQVDETDYCRMILLTVAASLTICYLTTGMEGFGLSRPKPKKVGGSKKNIKQPRKAKRARKVKEGFENSPTGIIKQLPEVMGPYDGLCIQTGNQENWMKSPDQTALIPNDALFTFLSSQGPTKPVFTDNSSLTGPSIDGHPDSARKMFMLANNRTSPECCPSTFSTSTGCVCTTKNQRDFIASRGAPTGGGSKVDLQEI